MLNLVVGLTGFHVIAAVIVAIWFRLRANKLGKTPDRWTVIGGAVYFGVAWLVAALLAWVWIKGYLPTDAEGAIRIAPGFVAAVVWTLLVSTALGLVVTLHVFCASLSGETARRMNAKTFAFEGAAVLLALVGWIAGPGLPRAESSQQYVGQSVFDNITDPTGATSLEVVRYEPKDNKLVTFRVAKDKGVWSIPSHQAIRPTPPQHLAEVAGASRG